MLKKKGIPLILMSLLSQGREEASAETLSEKAKKKVQEGVQTIQDGLTSNPIASSVGGGALGAAATLAVGGAGTAALAGGGYLLAKSLKKPTVKERKKAENSTPPPETREKESNAPPSHSGQQEGIEKENESSPSAHLLDRQDYTELHLAARDGDLERVKRLVEANPGILNITDNKLRTPLHKAAKYGHLEVVKFLKENGADLQAKDNQKQTPLTLAEKKSSAFEIGNIAAFSTRTPGNRESDDPSVVFERKREEYRKVKEVLKG